VGIGETCGICVGSDHAGQSTLVHNRLCPFALDSGNQVGVEFLAGSDGCGSGHCAVSPGIKVVWLYTDSPLGSVAGVPQESAVDATDGNGELKADVLKLDPGDGGNGTVNRVVRCGAEGGFERPVTGTDTRESGDDLASSSVK